MRNVTVKKGRKLKKGKFTVAYESSSFFSEGSIIEAYSPETKEKVYFQFIPEEQQIKENGHLPHYGYLDELGQIDREAITFRKINKIGQGSYSNVKKARKVCLNYKLCVVQSQPKSLKPGEFYIYEDKDSLRFQAVLKNGSIVQRTILKETMKNKYKINPEKWDTATLEPIFVDFLGMVARDCKFSCRLEPFSSDEKDSEPYVARITSFDNRKDPRVAKTVNNLMAFHSQPERLYLCHLDSNSKKKKKTIAKGVSNYVKVIQFMPYAGDNLRTFIELCNEQYEEQKEKNLVTPLDDLRLFRLYLKIMLAVSKALNDFHKTGYIHGDLKDLNILILVDGQENIKVSIIDFDGAKPIGETGSISSTKGYQAPEVQGALFFPIFYQCNLEGIKEDRYKNTFVYVYNKTEGLSLYYIDAENKPTTIEIEDDDKEALAKFFLNCGNKIEGKPFSELFDKKEIKFIEKSILKSITPRGIPFEKPLHYKASVDHYSLGVVCQELLEDLRSTMQIEPESLVSKSCKAIDDEVQKMLEKKSENRGSSQQFANFISNEIKKIGNLDIAASNILDNVKVSKLDVDRFIQDNGLNPKYDLSTALFELNKLREKFKSEKTELKSRWIVWDRESKISQIDKRIEGSKCLMNQLIASCFRGDNVPTMIANVKKTCPITEAEKQILEASVVSVMGEKKPRPNNQVTPKEEKLSFFDQIAFALSSAFGRCNSLAQPVMAANLISRKVCESPRPLTEGRSVLMWARPSKPQPTSASLLNPAPRETRGLE